MVNPYLENGRKKGVIGRNAWDLDLDSFLEEDEKKERKKERKKEVSVEAMDEIKELNHLLYLELGEELNKEKIAG